MLCQTELLSSFDVENRAIIHAIASLQCWRGHLLVQLVTHTSLVPSVVRTSGIRTCSSVRGRQRGFGVAPSCSSMIGDGRGAARAVKCCLPILCRLEERELCSSFFASRIICSVDSMLVDLTTGEFSLFNDLPFRLWIEISTESTAVKVMIAVTCHCHGAILKGRGVRMQPAGFPNFSLLQLYFRLCRIPVSIHALPSPFPSSAAP